MQKRVCAFWFVFCLSAYGQPPAPPLSRCGTLATVSGIDATNRPGGQIFEQWVLQSKQILSRTTSDTSILLIPVVFHVMHNGEAEGQGANLSQARIMSQIQILNQDYGKFAGSRGDNQDSNGTDTRIRFVLASQTRAGGPINPISRTNTGRPAWYQDQLDTLKNMVIQNPDFYLNIWTANLAGGSLGYSSWPQSGLGGLSNDVQNPNHDGVVIDYKTCGINLDWQSGYNLGRTATHEIGHFLGLIHIWGQLSQGCDDTDYCADTPVSDGPNYGCPIGINTCPNLPGTDMVRNYLNYSLDGCMNIFTNDQAARMRLVLLGSLRRASLVGWHPTTTKAQNQGNYSELKNVEIYPNYSKNGVFYLNRLPDNTDVQVFDMLGRAVSGRKICRNENALGADKLTIERPGIYILVVKSDNQIRSFRLIYR